MPDPRWRRYLRFFGPDVDADVDDELRFHLEQRVAEYERAGLTRAEAERAARERFGDADRVAGELRAHDRRLTRRRSWRDGMMGLRQDLRFAVRTLRRAPGWTTGVVATLALGIGLATAVYTVADALLVRRLPVRDQDRLVVLWGVTPDGRIDHFPLLLRDASDFARSTRALERTEFFSYGGSLPVAVRMGDGTTRLRRAMVSGGFFELLGARPVIGRALRPDDDVRGASLVAVLSYRGWQRWFGGDPSVVGRRIELPESGKSYAIVGVMPRGLEYPRDVDFWVPVVPSSGPLGNQPVYAELLTIGRLRPTATMDDARADMTRFFQHFAPSSTLRRVRGVARPFPAEVLGDAGPAVVAFAVAAALLLLITCINVANLLLVRGLGRVREIAVRSALGAGSRRIVGQLVVESMLLAVGGGVLGGLLAVAAVRGFVALAPAGTPRVDEIRLGAPVLAGAVAITGLATLVFALVPALLSARVEAVNALRAGTRQIGAGRRFRLGSEGLVAGQLALALLILSSAAIVGRSLVAMERVDLAFDPSRLLIVDLTVPPTAFGDAKRQIALLDQLVPQLQAIPGVRSVTPVLTPPFASAGGVFGRGLPAEGQTPDDIARNPTVDYEPVMPNFFATFGIPLQRGRPFTGADDERAPPVVVIGESLARHYWPGQDPVGKRFERGTGDFLTVVGVAADARYRDLRDPRPRIYLPLAQSQFPVAPSTLVIAAAGQPADLAPAVRRTVSAAGLGLRVAGAAPFTTLLDEIFAQPRLNTLLLALFAAAALALAAVGLFGAMATAVRQRTREIGVRVALGATPRQVRRLILDHAVAIAGVGGAVGLVGALIGGQLLRTLLFGVSPTDALALGVACILLFGVAVLAAHLPARRAAKIDPARTLRSE